MMVNASQEIQEEGDEPMIRVDQGLLRGRTVTNKDGSTFVSFLGVPYAQPPVGPLRYKIPQPPEAWTGTKEAFKHGNSAPQINWLMQLPYRGDEDCLYLNVYSPKLPSEEESVSHAVMVWIHGGGYEVGSGDSSVYGPEYLLTENVVVVTFNYRLGVLGFLSVHDDVLPDNIGMKDQVAALKWVKTNIEHFGGDPDNITIFGNSAGGASVNYHLVSPMSKGLFHKAIMQSGCVFNAWSEALLPKDLAFELGKELGCDTNSSVELVEFLSNVPARDLVETHLKMKTHKVVGQRPRFGPVPEVAETGEMFLPACATTLMEQGDFHSVPCIIGCNSQEGILLLEMNGIIKKPSVLRQIGENLQTQIPSDISSKLTKAEIAERMKQFYFSDHTPNETHLKEYIDLTSDAWFTRGLVKVANIIASKDSPVYFYHFDFSGKFNVYKNFLRVPYFSGAAHLDETGYIFKAPFFKLPEVSRESPEWITMKRVVQMWTNFAKKGDPVLDIVPEIKVSWPPYNPKNPEYLSIRNELSVEKDFIKERLDFWNNL